MQYVVLDDRVKRRMMPLFDWSCGNYVGMSGEHQQRMNLATAEPYIPHLTIG
jgi:hypothetical protein